MAQVALRFAHELVPSGLRARWVTSIGPWFGLMKSFVATERAAKDGKWLCRGDTMIANGRTSWRRQPFWAECRSDGKTETSSGLRDDEPGQVGRARPPGAPMRKCGARRSDRPPMEGRGSWESGRGLPRSTTSDGLQLWSQQRGDARFANAASGWTGPAGPWLGSVHCEGDRRSSWPGPRRPCAPSTGRQWECRPGLDAAHRKEVAEVVVGDPGDSKFFAGAIQGALAFADFKNSGLGRRIDGLGFDAVEQLRHPRKDRDPAHLAVLGARRLVAANDEFVAIPIDVRPRSPNALR